MRSRNIKPGFYKNDILAEVDPLGRILFTGLWCMADREGRLECRPKKIKAEVLPYDNCNMTKLLRDLEERKFIIQYSANGCNYIQIVNFLKHQTPHIKEAESTIPAPDLSDTSTSKKSLIPDSLIPDSLIPDSSIPESGSPPVHPPKKLSHSKCYLPKDFKISDSNRELLKEYPYLEEHLIYFKDWATAGAKQYADWDAVFRNCVRGDWGKIRENGGKTTQGFANKRTANNLRNAWEFANE